jgi:phosphoserine phosphatase
MARNITTILFDLDDTLMFEMETEDRVIRKVLAPIAERFGLDLDFTCKTVRDEAEKLWIHAPAYDHCESLGFCSWEGLWSTFESNYPAMAPMKEWGENFRIQSWVNALDVLNISENGLAAELAKAYQQARRSTHIIFDDANTVLTDLKQDYRLGLLTNGAEEIQQTKIDGSGLEHYFDATVITGAVGIGKPDPKPFNVIMEQLEVTAAETAMVGNSMTSDVQGALNTGILAIWLNLDNSWHVPGITPDIEIKSLDKVRQAIENA